MNLFLVIGNQEISFENAPQFVKYAVKLIIEMYGNDMNDAPKFKLLQAHKLAELYGVPHP